MEHKDESSNVELGDCTHVEKALEQCLASGTDLDMYREALEQYPNDASIDKEAETHLRHKIDRRILPLLGICYFFYARMPFCRTVTEAFANAHS